MHSKLALVLVALIFATPAFARGGGHSAGHTTASTPSSHRIMGYTRHDGTVVAPSHATNPNGTQRDNYTAQGNVNPYTGAIGTKPATR